MRPAAPEAERLRGVAGALRAVADAIDDGRAQANDLDELIVQLRGIRRRTFGSQPRRGSARERIAGLLVRRVGEWVTGDELAEVAGVSEWARRLRELRQSGYVIEESGGSYRLVELPRS